MTVYYIVLILVFVLNQKLNSFHDKTENKLLARSAIVSLSWPILISAFFTFILAVYILSICDILTEWLGNFLDEIE